MKNKKFRVIGHRGACGYAPENTLASFQVALNLGASEIETDVQFTRDKHLVLIHDEIIDRTTNGSGDVADYTLQELRTLDAGSWFTTTSPSQKKYMNERLITLGELFEHFGKRFIYHVEIKRPEDGITRAVLERIKTHDLLANTVITSLDKASLIEMRQLNTNIPIGWIIPYQEGGGDFTALDEAKQLHFSQIVVFVADLSKAFVSYAHEIGLEVRAYGINTYEDMKSAINKGCDGMTIKWPDLAINYMQQRKQ